jgi:hypothetical protein
MPPPDRAQPPFQRNTQFPEPIKPLPMGSSSPMSEVENPPKAKGNPTKKKPTNPRPKMAKLVLTTWAACLARQNPVSTSAKPACMKTTKSAPRTTHSRLTCMPRTSTSVGSACCACWAPAGTAKAITPQKTVTAARARVVGRFHPPRPPGAGDVPDGLRRVGPRRERIPPTGLRSMLPPSNH